MSDSKRYGYKRMETDVELMERIRATGVWLSMDDMKVTGEALDRLAESKKLQRRIVEGS